MIIAENHAGIPSTHYSDLERSNKFRNMRLEIAKIYKAGQERDWQVEVWYPA